MGLLPHIQPHRPINSRSRIPAGIGQPGIIGNNGKLIFPTVIQTCQLYRIGCIAILMSADCDTVQGHCAVLIYALKLNQNSLVRPISRDSKGFFVSICPSGKVTVSAVRGIGAAPFQNLCIVGQGDGMPLAAALSGEFPVIVKADFLHQVLLFLIVFFLRLIGSIL